MMHTGTKKFVKPAVMQASKSAVCASSKCGWYTNCGDYVKQRS